MIISQFRDFVLRPTLEMIGLYSKSAEVLLLGTGLVESNFIYIKQIGTIRNGGFGFFQCENATYLDTLRYLKVNKKLGDRITAACNIDYFPPTVEPLIWNMRLATCICRADYFQVPKALPEPTDAMGFANYHKKYYNGNGKTDTTKSVVLFQKIIDGNYD